MKWIGLFKIASLEKDNGWWWCEAASFPIYCTSGAETFESYCRNLELGLYDEVGPYSKTFVVVEYEE